MPGAGIAVWQALAYIAASLNRLRTFIHAPTYACTLPFVCPGFASFAQSAEQRSTLADQQEVAVTIYNENLALVKDQRRLQLKPGTTSLAFHAT